MNAGTNRSQRLRIGDLVLDVGKRQVSRAGTALDLPKLSYRLLVALAESAPNVVTGEELVSRVWPGRVVSPETVTQRIKLLRQAIGDDATNPSYIGLVRGEGYRLIPDVEELAQDESTVTRGLFAELGRRRVLQVALIYAAVAWSITEVVSFLIESLPIFPDWSQALVAIVFVVGFPVAMFLAWRFDVGPDGIRRTASSRREERKTYAVAAVLLVGATAGLFYLIYPTVVEQSRLDDALVVREAPPNSVAVMPFVNATDDPDDQYLSTGLADELRDQLGRIETLKVVARSSSVAFRDSTTDAVTISRALGVRKLVEGSIRRQGNQLRITVQIIDGSTGFQEWTNSYTHLVGDLLAAQLKISAELASQIVPEIDATLVTSKPATLVASANEVMYLARHLFQEVQDAPLVDLPKMLRVIELYTQATTIAPRSAPAHARLGAAYLYIGDIKNAEAPIFRALALDDELSEVHNTLGLYRWLQFLPGSGEAHLRAVELNPNNADAQEKYGKWLWHQQITDDVVPYFLRALELDPLSLARYLDLGHLYAISNRRDEALAVAAQIEAKFSSADAFMALARTYELTGDLDVAIGWALRAYNAAPDDPEKSWLLGELYARIGDFEAAHHFDPDAFGVLYWERRYEDMIEVGEERVFDRPNEIQLWYGMARAHAALGEHEQAIYKLTSQGLPQRAKVDSRRANGVEAMVTLADAYNETGNTELAHEYASWLESIFARLSDTGAGDSWWPNMYRACSLSILQRDDEALAALDRIRNSVGIAWYPALTDAPCFRRFAGEPQYQEVVRHYEDRLEMLRDRLDDTLARFQQEDATSLEGS